MSVHFLIYYDACSEGHQPGRAGKQNRHTKTEGASSHKHAISSGKAQEYTNTSSVSWQTQVQQRPIAVCRGSHCSLLPSSPSHHP